MKAISINNKRNDFLLIAGLVVAIVVAYLKVVNAGFINWDDPEYVLQNKDIRGFNADHIARWFSQYYIGNYHPLTMFSFALDYSIAGTSPVMYHVTNILLHSGNALFLYFVAMRLGGKRSIAFFTAALFALHPMQTEAVSWVAERKTVLSAFFSLLTMLVYLRYTDRFSWPRLFVVYVLAIAAMLSKSSAVSLPVCLLALDLWSGRDLRKRQPWQEKLPVIAVAIATGIIALRSQNAAGFINERHSASVLQSLCLACYAYTQYLFRFLFPARLSVIYPYPTDIGFWQVAAVVAVISIGAWFLVALKRKWTLVSGGILFFTACIFPVLQFVPFGEVLTADRHAYLACIGISYPLVSYLHRYCKARIFFTVSGIAAATFLVLTFFRNDIWLSDLTFYSAILKVFPQSSVAQNSIGGVYIKLGNNEEALSHITETVNLDPQNYKAWYNEGVLYMRTGKLHDALYAFSRSIETGSYEKARFSRALLYEQMGDATDALMDIDTVLQSRPNDARAYYVKAACLQQLQKSREALENYDRAIDLQPDEPLFHLHRALLLASLQQFSAAVTDIGNAINLDPGNGEAYYERAEVAISMKQSPCADLQAAAKLGYKKAEPELVKYCGH
jgi:protein O-mannosyl-transferase